MYLLADSQLLFWKTHKGPYLEPICTTLSGEPARIAYVGASNGDSPEAYSILTAALEQVKFRSVHQITSAFTPEDQQALQEADVIVLAGGDVEAGWNVFKSNGLLQALTARLPEPITLVGVSAGAVQLGSHAAIKTDSHATNLIETFGFVRLIIDVHDEQNEWQTLSSTIHMLEGAAIGIGIPKGGGLIVSPDGVIQPVRHNVDEFIYEEGRLRHAVLLPDLVV